MINPGADKAGGQQGSSGAGGGGTEEGVMLFWGRNFVQFWFLKVLVFYIFENKIKSIRMEK